MNEMNILVPTMQLRIQRRVCEKVDDGRAYGIHVQALQQAFLEQETGHTVWIDVPVVEEAAK